MFDYKENDLIDGVVINVVSYGAFLIFPDNSTGLLHISEVIDGFIKNIFQKISIGQIYSVRVTGIDKETKFLKVSLKNINGDCKDVTQEVINSIASNENLIKHINTLSKE